MISSQRGYNYRNQPNYSWCCFCGEYTPKFTYRFINPIEVRMCIDYCKECLMSGEKVSGVKE